MEDQLKLLQFIREVTEEDDFSIELYATSGITQYWNYRLKIGDFKAEGVSFPIDGVIEWALRKYLEQWLVPENKSTKASRELKGE